MEYQITPKLNDFNFEFKANTDLLGISDLILKHGLKKFVYPNFSTIRLPGCRKEKLEKKEEAQIAL